MRNGPEPAAPAHHSQGTAACEVIGKGAHVNDDLAVLHWEAPLGFQVLKQPLLLFPPAKAPRLKLFFALREGERREDPAKRDAVGWGRVWRGRRAASA